MFRAPVCKLVEAVLLAGVIACASQAWAGQAYAPGVPEDARPSSQAPSHAAQPGGESSASSLSISSDVPFPPGLTSPHDVSTVRLGPQTMEVLTFVTNRPREELMAYYEQALTQLGWERALLPWQAHHRRVEDGMRQWLHAHPEAATAPTIHTQLAQAAGVSKLLRGQVYARRGEQHVIVNLVAMGQGTTVFLNRWSGAAIWDQNPAAPARRQSEEPHQTAWFETNVCCSGASVSNEAFWQSVGIPRHPQARVMAESRSEASGQATVLLEIPEGPEHVLAYYRARLSSQGWQLVSRRADVIRQRRQTGDALTYEHAANQQVCVLTAHPMSPPRPWWKWWGATPNTLLTIAVARVPMTPQQARSP